MFLQQFPDLIWLKTSIENRFEARRDWRGNALKHTGWPSVILNVKGSNICRDNIIGPVSLFSNISGKSTVTAEGRRVVIPEGYFFVTNEGQSYTLEVEKKQTETFNVHFGTHFVAQVLQSFLSSDFNPGALSLRPDFRNRLIPIDSKTNSLIKNLKANSSEMGEEENLFSLLENLLKHEQDLQRQIQRVPAQKKSTKDEVMKRLLTSVDFIYAYSEKDLSLDNLANEACLSKFHFLRLFKSAFNKTPLQFIHEVRAERAKVLLKKWNMPVKEVAHETGFDCSSSFSRAFFKTVGLYPTQFQRV